MQFLGLRRAVGDVWPHTCEGARPGRSPGPLRFVYSKSSRIIIKASHKWGFYLASVPSKVLLRHFHWRRLLLHILPRALPSPTRARTCSPDIPSRTQGYSNAHWARDTPLIHRSLTAQFPSTHCPGHCPGTPQCALPQRQPLPLHLGCADSVLADRSAPTPDPLRAAPRSPGDLLKLELRSCHGPDQNLYWLPVTCYLE